MIIGGPWLAWARAKAAVMMGELSVRIVVPMDMKNLRKMLAQLRKLFDRLSSRIPKGGSRANHVLAQSPHHAVRARAEADDVGRAEDEANDQADS
jgi:hypothetical protein